MNWVFAFYRFAAVTDPELLASQLQPLCEKLTLRGTILVAGEGLNGTLSGSKENLSMLCDRLREEPGFAELEGKYSRAKQDNVVFHRMKVRVKPEIVAMGVPGVNPARKTGIHADVATWNALLADPDVIVIDTRNDYEIDIGHFPGAINPKTQSFREFPEFVEQTISPEKHPRVAMFCTGGIRCEKASAYMLEKGFKEVYQLDGGILKYMELAEPSANLWQGECFIFDQRVSVNKNLEQGQYVQCHACRHPLTHTETESSKYVLGESCDYCHAVLTDKQKSSFAERQRQVNLARDRGERHIGLSPPAKARKIVNKVSSDDKEIKARSGKPR